MDEITDLLSQKRLDKYTNKKLAEIKDLFFGTTKMQHLSQKKSLLSTTC